MQLSRKGESLWQEWDGEALEPVDPADIVFFTIEHVDLDHEVVRRALASLIQRSGIVDSLGDAYRVLGYAVINHGYAGLIDENILSLCDEKGETYLGELVALTLPITWVEVSHRG